MACLASVLYDPSVAVLKDTSAALAMTALDTTNLRLTFTAPANGNVLVRLRGAVHGTSTHPQILLGVLSGATIIGRQVGMGARAISQVTERISTEASFVVTGLTPGNSFTWDAAYGVEFGVSSSNLKYGGPNDTTTDNAFGGFAFEVWETPTLLASLLYDPASAVAKATSTRIVLTAFDTSNARLSFTAPASGRVWWRIRTTFDGSSSFPSVLLGVLSGGSVLARAAPVLGCVGTALATTHVCLEASGVISGLSGAQTWDAAYGVEVLVASTNIHYGGPDNATASDAWGGILFEVWTA